MNRACAGPPTRNQVSGPRGSLAMSRPRRFGSLALSSGTISKNRAGRLPTTGRSTATSRPNPGTPRSRGLICAPTIRWPGGQAAEPMAAPPVGCVSRRVLSPQGREFVGQRVSPLGDRTGAEANHIIARVGEAADDAGELVLSVDRDHVAMAS